MTTVTDPRGDRFQAVMLRGHLRLLDVGMRNSRMSGTKILALAGKITGKKYKRGQYSAAIADLTNKIEEIKKQEAADHAVDFQYHRIGHD